MTKLKVYLGGPITGLSYEEAIGWRSDPEFVKALDRMGWQPLDPMRKVPEQDEPYEARVREEAVEESEVKTDLADIRASQAVLFNFLHAKHVSLGSAAEMGYAHALAKPIISLWLPESPHDHLFTSQMSTYQCTDLWDALWVLERLGRVTKEPEVVPYA